MRQRGADPRFLFIKKTPASPAANQLALASREGWLVSVPELVRTAGEAMIYPPVTATYKHERVRLVRVSGRADKYFEIYHPAEDRFITGVPAIRLSSVRIHKSLREVPSLMLPLERQHSKTICRGCGAIIRPPKRRWCSKECNQKHRTRRKWNERTVGRPAGRVCFECGIASLDSYDTRRKYCSKECSNAALSRAEQERRKRLRRKPIDCGVCNRRIVTSSTRRKYCSKSCGRKALVAMSNERNKRLRWEAWTKREFTCKVCGGTFNPTKKNQRTYCSDDCSRAGYLEIKRRSALKRRKS